MRHPRLPVRAGLALGLLLAVLTACGGEEAPVAEPVDVGVDVALDAAGPLDGLAEDADASQPPPDAAETTETSEPDLGPEPDAEPTCPGGPGCACTANGDCGSAFCIEDPAIAGGKACAQTCVETCPLDYACAQVTAGAGDVASICVPKKARLCDPCATSEDCESTGLANSACVDQGALGRFCGIACGATADCPAGYGCQLVPTAEGGKLQQCVRLPDDGGAPFGVCPCSATAVAKKLATACFVEVTDGDGKPVGQCAGSRACLEEGLSACSAPPASDEACDGVDNDCNGKTDDVSCDDGKVCTFDGCEGKNGCQSVVLDGTGCDADGSVCTENDTCQGDVCTPGKAKNCDDKNPCTLDSCDATAGCQQAPDDGAPCDDENPCTVGDLCAAKQCAPGAAKECTSTKPCVVAECDLTDGGKCKYSNKKAGTACDDGDACTAADACLDGACDGQLVDCDDKNACTADSCDPGLGCKSSPTTAPCDDGNACTVGDLCGGGTCVGLAKNVTVDCDDGNPCTSEGCLPDSGCTHGANQAPCSDGNPCTIGDTCAAKVCAPGVNSCECEFDGDCAGKEDGNFCNGTLFCDKQALPYKCAVLAKTVVACDLSGDTTCTTTQCNPKDGQCVAVSEPDGKPCDADGSLCTVADACALGSCQAGAAKSCDDGNPCTDDSCAPQQGCVFTPNTLACSDGNACTGSDTCKDGDCEAKPLVCDDGDVCTDDSCDKTQGCQYLPNTSVCTDGNACTGQDVCAAGTCTGAAVVCDDQDPCTADSCDPSGGCVQTPLAEKADCSADGKAWCVAGKCQPKASCGDGVVNQPSEQCDDGNQVDNDACNNACQLTAKAGQVAFTAAGSHSWVVPAGVTKVSIVTIGGGAGGWGGADVAGGGGGGLAYVNHLPVTPGETLQITVGAGGKGGYFGQSPSSSDKPGTPGGQSKVVRGSTTLLFADGGFVASSATTTSPGGGFGGTAPGLVGFKGGNGNGGSTGGSMGSGGGEGQNGGGSKGGYGGAGFGGGGGGGSNGGGGGGAGGYGAAGGGGSGGSATSSSAGGAGGGGVGLFGTLSKGTNGGNGGPGGSNSPGGAGGTYGGGGGGVDDGNVGGNGGGGAVRILWQGSTTSVRAFPSTNTGNL